MTRGLCEQRAVMNTSPDGSDGGIWQSDAGAAADEAGNIYIATGNGDFNAASGGRDYGDTVMKLELEGKKFAVRDYFTPFNQKELDAKDGDLGSQGPVLLSAAAGAHPHLLVVTGKEGKLYLLDRDRLGKFHEGSDSEVLQTIKTKDAYGAVAAWNGHVYFTDRMDTTRDFRLEGGQLVLKGTTSEDGAARGDAGGVGEWDEGCGAVGGGDEGVERRARGPAGGSACVRRDGCDEGALQQRAEQRAGSRGDDGAVRDSYGGDGRVFVGARGKVDVYGLVGARY